MAYTQECERIAKTCHEVNRSYCEALGDHSQVPWEDAPDWQRASACQGVVHFIEDPTCTPKQMHDNWMATKVADGWKLGPVKDAEKKEHPCMVPYEMLPEEQKTKDALFIAVVRSLA